MRKIIFLSEAPIYDVGRPGDRKGPLELRSANGKRFASRKQFDDYTENGDVIYRSDGKTLVKTPSGHIVYTKGEDNQPREIVWKDKPIKKK